MGVTVFHNLSATTPDDPAYEIRPSHWNSAHSVSVDPFVISAGTNSTQAPASVVFSNANGVTFGMDTNGAITATVTPGAAAGIAAIQAGTNTATSGTVVFSNSNGLSFGMATNGVVTGSYSLPAGGTMSAINFSAGTTSQNLTALTFSNSNGLAFGLNGSVVTGSYTVPTQSVQTQASGAIAGSGFTSTTIAGIVVAGTNDSNGLKLAVPGYITTWNQSNQTVASGNIAGTGFSSTTTAGTAIVGTNNTAGLSLGVPLFLTTQSVQTQASGNIAGAGFTSTTTAGVVPVATQNSAGLSIAVPNWITTYAAQTNQTVASGNIAGVGTTFAGTNVSGSMTLNSNGLNLALSAGAGGGGGFTGGVSTGGNTVGNTGTQTGSLILVGGNNITLSVGTASGGAQTITISGANAGGAQTGISSIGGGGTTYTSGAIQFVNSNNFSFLSTTGQGFVGSFSTSQSVQPVAFSASGGSSAFSTLGFSNANGFTFSNSNGSVVGSYTVPTVPTAYVSSVNGTSGAVSFAVGSSLSSATVNGSTTFGLASNITTALQSAGAYLTTAAQSSVSNVSGVLAATNNTGGGTATLSGNISFSNANGLTFYTSAGNAIVGSYTVPSTTGFISAVNVSGGGSSGNVTQIVYVNSNNVTFGVSTGGGGPVATITASVAAPITTQAFYFVGNTTGQSSSSTAAEQTISFSGAGIASLGWSAGQVIVSVPAGGGGGDGYNIVSMMTSTSGGGTAGATFSALSGSIGLMAGSNITLSQTSNTIVINGPSGGAGPTLSDWEPIPLGASTTQALGLNTVYFQPLYPQNNVSFSCIEFISNISISSSAIAGWTKGSTISYGLYAQDTGTRNTQMTLLSSSSFAVNMTASSNASFMVSVSQGANSTTYSTAASIHSAVNGTKIVSLPFAGTMSAGGNYFLGFVQSTSTAGANVASTVGMLFNNEYAASFGALAPNTLGASAASIVHEPFGFIYATTSGALPGTVPNTAQSITNNWQPYLFFEA